MVGPEEGRQPKHPRRFIASLSTQVGMGCARWTYEPEEAVLKSAREWIGWSGFFFLRDDNIKQDPTEEDEVLSLNRSMGGLFCDGTDREPVVAVAVVPIHTIRIEVEMARAVRVDRIEGRRPIVSEGTGIVEIGIVPVACGRKALVLYRPPD